MPYDITAASPSSVASGYCGCWLAIGAGWTTCTPIHTVRPRDNTPQKNTLLPQLFMIKREITMSGFMASKNDNLLQSAAEVDRKMNAAAKLTGSSGWQTSREFS